MGLSEVYGGQNYVIVYNIFNIIYNIKYYYNTRLAKLNLTFRYGGIPMHIIQVNEWRIRFTYIPYPVIRDQGLVWRGFVVPNMRHSELETSDIHYRDRGWSHGVYIRCHLIQRVPRGPRAVEPRVPRGRQVLQVDDSLHFHFRWGRVPS